jgi:DNA repair protein RadC
MVRTNTPVASWGDVELLAAALGGDLARAAEVWTALGGWAGLHEPDVDALRQRAPLTPTAARRLLVAVEVGRRALVARRAPGVRLDDPHSAYAVFAPRLAGLRHEELHAAFIDRRNQVLDVRRLTVGSEQYTVVDPRQIYRVALSLRAAAVVLAHNHPSGDPTPSRQDDEVTRRVAEVGLALGVPLLDHLVVAEDGWQALSTLGRIPGVGARSAWSG